MLNKASTKFIGSSRAERTLRPLKLPASLYHHHLGEEANWPSIRRHGLLNTTRLSTVLDASTLSCRTGAHPGSEADALRREMVSVDALQGVLPED
jgi:hypothetical protein